MQIIQGILRCNESHKLKLQKLFFDMLNVSFKTSYVSRTKSKFSLILFYLIVTLRLLFTYMKENNDMTTLELEAYKAELARQVLSIDSFEVLDAVKRTIKRMKNKVTAQEETISKEEILAGIREGLLEMKEARRTGKKLKTAEELLDEL